MCLLDRKNLNGLINLIKYWNLIFHFLVNFFYFEIKFANKNWGFFNNLIHKYSLFIGLDNFSKPRKINLLREIRLLLNMKNILKKIKISIILKKITRKFYFKKKAKTLNRIKKGSLVKKLIIEKTKSAYKKLLGFSFQELPKNHILNFCCPKLLKKKNLILFFDKRLIDFKNSKRNYKIFSVLNQNLIIKFFQKIKHLIFLIYVLFKRIVYFPK